MWWDLTMNGQQLTQDDVTRQRELPQALRLMRRCGIETNKVKEIEDAQQRLIKHMYKQRGQEVGEKPDVSRTYFFEWTTFDN